MTARAVQNIDPAEPVPAEVDLVCEGCGYSLVGLSGDRCPECGESFDPNELPLARVPWLFRKRYGAVRAYLMTVWMVIVHPITFAREMSRPIRISPSDALSFRRLTIRVTMGLAMLVNVVVTCTMFIYWAQRYGFSIVYGNFWKAIAVTLGTFPGLWVFLWLATDLPTFIWKGLPAKPYDLAPLHHYACAPLAFAPIIALGGMCGWLAMVILDQPAYSAVQTVGFFGMIAGVVILLLIWWTPLLLMRGATGCGSGRQLLLGFYLPIHWAMMAVLGFLLVLLMVGIFTGFS